MATNTKIFDIAEHLETDDDIREFLQETAATVACGVSSPRNNGLNSEPLIFSKVGVMIVGRST